MTQEIIVEWTPKRSPRRRLRFEPVGDDWRRIEEEWTGCTWRRVGHDRVDDVQVELGLAEAEC